MELEGLEARRKGRLMAALSMVFTARYAASYLRVDVEVIEELAEQMAPEDGRLSVIDSLDERAESVTAFTRQVSNISTTSSMIAGHSSCETSQPAAAFAGWILQYRNHDAAPDRDIARRRPWRSRGRADGPGWVAHDRKARRAR